MSALPALLSDVLSRFDDAAYEALANRGLVRRARKELGQHQLDVIEQAEESVTVGFGGHRIQFDARGPAHARCDCPAVGTCHHLLAASMAMQRMLLADGDRSTAGIDPRVPLMAALLALTTDELIRHAGKAGYRWAWQCVHDLEAEQALVIGGTEHVILTLQRPRVTLRYMGGGMDGLLADTALPQLEKYRVAAVLAFQRAHGREPQPPEPASRYRHASLGLEAGQALAEPSDATQEASRAGMRTSLLAMLVESIELGLTHLSRGMWERYATLAVWAQGADYSRLALLLRRIAAHVELLLERAVGADERQLLDELSLAFALVSALDTAAARGAAPRHLVGQARTRYDASAVLELVGLGSQAWRTSAGYVGLTMVFWSPRDQAFMSCTDARPAVQRGFDPVARYLAGGPWSGLASPRQATGRKVLLQGAQLNEAGRLSGVDSAVATVVPINAEALVSQLNPWGHWAALRLDRTGRRRSLLAAPEPLKDWVAVEPARFEPARFDKARQTLVWPLKDAAGEELVAELPFDAFNRHAIGRVERLQPASLAPGTLLIGRLRSSRPRGLVLDPLSLVRPGGGDAAVDALHFDAPSDATEEAARVPSVEGAEWLQPASTEAARASPDSPAGILRGLRQDLQRHAERGVSPERGAHVRAELVRHGEQLAGSGLGAFRIPAASEEGAAAWLLRLNYLCMQCEQLMEGGA